MFLLKIPYRSLIYRKKQYSSLFLVCMFGVAISLFCIFLTDGMMDSLNSKAKIYYGGDFQFLCSQNNVLQTYRCEEDIEILKNSFLRSVYRYAQKYFESEDELIIESHKRRIKQLEKEKLEYQHKYFKVIKKVYDKYGTFRGAD